jgi:hypothetical protein
MSTDSWRMEGESVVVCDCAWGCPCQFNALPTNGRCEALGVWEVREGTFGSTRLDGVRFARIYSWPGPIHEGNGTRQLIIEEGASDEQRRALDTLDGGAEGGAYFEVFAAVCPNRLDTVTASIELTVDRDQRTASLRIPTIAEAQVEPIKNPVTGDTHRARIDLPGGFEYEQAEMGNTVHAHVSTGPISFTLENTYAQLNPFSWSNA